MWRIQVHYNLLLVGDIPYHLQNKSIHNMIKFAKMFLCNSFMEKGKRLRERLFHKALVNECMYILPTKKLPS